MCLIPKEVNGKTIQTAERDIVCYKRVFTYKTKWAPVYSPLPREYKYNKVLVAEKSYWLPWSMPDILYPIAPVRYKEIKHLQKCTYEVGDWVINEGFHAHLRRKDVPYTCGICHRTKICIIPKGTEICYGINDDIVAVNMIVFRNLFQYLKYKLKKSFGKK